MRLKLVLLLCFAALPAFGQSTAKTFTLNAANQCATIGVSGLSTVGIQVTGTFSATLQPEVAIAGQSPQNTQVTPSTSSTAQATITATGVYKAAVGGFDEFLVCVSSYSSGTATVWLNPSGAVNASLFGGGAAGISTASFGVMATATKYGLHYDGRFIQDATITSGSNAVSCPNSDCNFTAADTGKICFGTNMTTGGGTVFLSATVILPQGTLTVTGAQTATCSGGNATGSTVGAGVLIWGSDDTMPLANAWADALADCTMLVLPGQNSQGTGPAVMLVQSEEFGVSHGAASSARCSFTGGSGRGVGLKGQGIRATYVIPTANFNAATCTGFGQTNESCFFGFSDGGDVEDVTFYGGGNSNPGSGFNGHTAFEFNATNWMYVKNVQLIGWGANGTKGIANCVFTSGLYVTFDHVLEDGCGQTGFDISSGQSSIVLLANVAYDNSGPNLSLVTTATNPVYSYAGLYGDSSTGSCNILVGSSSQFASLNDTIGDNNVDTTTGEICVSFGGSATVDGDSLTGTTNSMIAIKTIGTGVAYVHNTQINLTGTTTTGISNAGTIFDQGGNTITATTPRTGAGTYYNTAGGPTSTFTSAGVVSIGTTFTTNNGCGETTGLAGGSTAGKITTAGSTGCTTVVTMGNSATAPNGWSCTAIDLTTSGDVTNPHQTATSQTTATFASGTIVAADVIQFSCIGY